MPRTGGDTLTAPKDRAVLEFALEWSGEEKRPAGRRWFQDYGDGAEHDELEEDMSRGGSDELWDEGEKEERGLGVEGFGPRCPGENAPAMALWLRLRVSALRVRIIRMPSQTR